MGNILWKARGRQSNNKAHNEAWAVVFIFTRSSCQVSPQAYNFTTTVTLGLIVSLHRDIQRLTVGLTHNQTIHWPLEVAKPLIWTLTSHVNHLHAEVVQEPHVSVSGCYCLPAVKWLRSSAPESEDEGNLNFSSCKDGYSINDKLQAGNFCKPNLPLYL